MLSVSERKKETHVTYDRPRFISSSFWSMLFRCASIRSSFVSMSLILFRMG